MRNYTLDVFKFIACFLVVFIHCHVERGYLLALTRVAVPIFFMISGYYYQIILNKNKEQAYLKKIVHITLFATILYAFVSIGDFPTLSFKAFWRWGIFNEVPFERHLWYLYSLIYVLLIVRYIRKRLTPSSAIGISITLILINYALSFQHNEELYRNFLFTGLPYFLTGYYLYTQREKIAHSSICPRTCLYIALGMMALLFTEFFVYNTCHITPIRDHYLMVYPLCISLFCYAIKKPDLNEGGKISAAGQKYSTDVYIYHIIVIYIGNYLVAQLYAQRFIDSTRNGYFYPVIILFLTIASVSLCRHLSTWIKGFLKKES